MDFYHENNREALNSLRNNPNPSSGWNRFFKAFNEDYIRETLERFTQRSFGRDELRFGRTKFLLENPNAERYANLVPLEEMGGWDDNIPLIGMVKPSYFRFRKPIFTGLVIDEFGEEVVSKTFGEIPEGLRFVRTDEMDEINFLLANGFEINSKEKKSYTLYDIDGMPLGLRHYDLYTLRR